MSRHLSREARNLAVTGIVTSFVSVAISLTAVQLCKEKSDEDIIAETLAATVVTGDVHDGVGAGWFINDRGDVVTANHVIDSSKKNIQVILPNKTLADATFVCEDKAKDITVLHVKTKNNKFIEWADSSRVVRGDRADQIGTPFSLAYSASFGHVSAPIRQLEDIGAPTVQYDAATNPGNSGGPIVNGEGKLIGMSDEIYTATFFGRNVAQSSGVAFGVTAYAIAASLPRYLLEGNMPTFLETQTAKRTGFHPRLEPTCLPPLARGPR